MKPQTSMLNSLKYIEENIKEPLTAEAVAQNAGYSLYYFSRIFKKQTGLAVMEYVKDRRLIKASEEIAKGMKIIDAALDFGYQSHSGFTKAFTNKFGFSPALLRAFRFQMKCLGGNGNMEHVFMKNMDAHAPKEELFELLLRTTDGNKLEYDQEKIKKAYQFACIAHQGKKRYSGDDYVTHPINTAILLSEMEAGEDVIIAGLLHDVISENSGISLDVIRKEFSDGIADIIDGVMKFERESEFDEAVLMVKLADRLHNMRTIEFMDASRWKEKAKETIEIFSPIAARLNNEKIMAELNDLAMRFV